MPEDEAVAEQGPAYRRMRTKHAGPEEHPTPATAPVHPAFAKDISDFARYGP